MLDGLVFEDRVERQDFLVRRATIAIAPLRSGGGVFATFFPMEVL